MKFVKCPRCELNYIMPGEKYCKVCQREMKGEGTQDEIEMCSVCNENPALPGRDICLFCLKEMSGQNGVDGNGEDDSQENEDPVDPHSITSMDNVSSMDELPVVGTDDLPADEFAKMAGEITSLETMQEDEAKEDGDEDEDEQ